MMARKTFARAIGWRRVKDAAEAAIKLAEIFNRYAVGDWSLQEWLENFQAGPYQGATDWAEITEGFSRWQRWAVLRGLSLFFYYSTPGSKPYLALRMRRADFVSEIGYSPLKHSFGVMRWLCEEMLEKPLSVKPEVIEELSKETLSVPGDKPEAIVGAGEEPSEEDL